jgi:hypothetical protein
MTAAPRQHHKRRPRPATLALAALLACSAEPTVVALELGDDASCTPPRLAALASVSVEVYGDADGQPCTLARRCITIDAAQELADITAALHAAMQPLVDLELAGTRQIAILGHSRLGCGEGDRGLCGFADLADADDSLVVPIHCDDPDAPICPLTVPAFCP